MKTFTAKTRSPGRDGKGILKMPVGLGGIEAKKWDGEDDFS
jgi:hypothetical protein